MCIRLDLSVLVASCSYYPIETQLTDSDKRVMNVIPSESRANSMLALRRKSRGDCIAVCRTIGGIGSPVFFGAVVD